MTLEPFERLAVAVLRRAVWDAQAGSKGASKFLRSRGCQWVAEMLGITPSYWLRMVDACTTRISPLINIPEQWIDIAQAEQLTGYSSRRLYYLVGRKLVESCRIGRKIHISVSSFNSYYMERSVTARRFKRNAPDRGCRAV